MTKSRGKLTNADVKEIRKVLRSGAMTQVQLAAFFRVSNVAVHFAAVGKTFAHVKSPKPLQVSR